MQFRYDIAIPKWLNSAVLQSDMFHLKTRVYQSHIVICNGIPYILFSSISRLRDLCVYVYVGVCVCTIDCHTKESG
jgi:hypothetical protein